jgi:hypothetical protein
VPDLGRRVSRPRLDGTEHGATLRQVDWQFGAQELWTLPHRNAALALVGAIFAHQQVLDELLGYGRASLRAPGLREVADERADQAAFVDTLSGLLAWLPDRDPRKSRRM